MIYPWYDETRWLREIFRGNASHGTDLVRQYCPPGATAHFRTSGASFRVNGLEYARVGPTGSVRRAIGTVSWQEDSVSPSRLVAALRETFDRIAADHDGFAASQAPLDWAKGLVPEGLAVCMVHAIRQHIPEHWLESLLVAQPSLLGSGIKQARSQVVVGKKGDDRWKFIDLLCLDEPEQTLWVVEIKAPKANGEAIGQVAEYVVWVKSNLSEIMRPDNGYFITSLSPADMKVGAIIVAPYFTNNIGDYVGELLPCLEARGRRVAAKWRSDISCEPCELPTRKLQRSRPVLAEGAVGQRPYAGRWSDRGLVRRLVAVAEQGGLVVREEDPRRSDYVNVRRPGGNQPVVAQLHLWKDREAEGVAVVLREPPEGLIFPKPLRRLDDFSLLSGDRGPNRSWLRSEGRFRHLPSARCAFVPNVLEGKGDEHEAWQTIREMFRCHAGRVAVEGSEPYAVVVTHGDIDGMVAAAIVVRRERSVDCEVAFSNARGISKKLQQALRRESPPGRLYVCDIPASADAYTVANALNEAGVEVRWIDHHPWDDVTPEQMTRVCKEVVYNEGTNTPAGVLAGEWQGERDAYCGRIGRICYASERGTEWERNWFRLLASYVGKGRKDVLERLAFDRPFTEGDKRRIADQALAETVAEAILAQSPRTVTTTDGRSMAVYDTSSKPGVFLGRKVLDRHEVDLCLIRVLPRKWQIACRPRDGLSLASLVGEHAVRDGLLHVGGREKQLLAIEVIANAPAGVDLHEAIVDWVSSKL